MKKISISPLAAQDMEGIGDYIAADNPKRALSFVHELEAKCMSIAQNPMLYPARPELGQSIHGAAHGKYLVIYRVESERVCIIRVLHGARDVLALFEDMAQ